MAHPKKKRKVLLLEPDYANKFPPVGLMKLATYYRNQGDWDVVFYKGDLNRFVIERIADKCIDVLSCELDCLNWHHKKDIIVEFIKTRKRECLYQLLDDYPEIEIQATNILLDFNNYYWKGVWKKEPEWDRVCVTTLFTFYWDITIDTINFAKLLVKTPKDLLVGGVLASIQPDELYRATGIKPHVGILHTPGDLDRGDAQIIDELPLDYSILNEIEYQYPMANAFYSYTTRGCIRHCSFCAVPTIEPDYNSFIPLYERISQTREMFGDQKDLLLMDNNVLASKDFPKIIQEIIKCGYGKDCAKYVQENPLELSIRNLIKGVNDNAYVRKSHSLILDFYSKLKGEESYIVYKVIDKYHITKLYTTTKENLISAYEEIKDLYNKRFHPRILQRYVDFNQGVDARLFNEDNVKLLASISIRPLRIAFDNVKTFDAYNRAVRLSVEAGIKHFSNYLLYNFDDLPIDLYHRLRINVEMCDELDVQIYSFPMKYHPINKTDGVDEDFSHNRDYIGMYWNRKYIRAVQAILNSTKGQIGKGLSFFLEAFGHNDEEYLELLEMPEVFILYRFFFKWLDDKTGRGVLYWRECWHRCLHTLSESEMNIVKEAIHANTITQDIIDSFESEDVRELLSLYLINRNDIGKPEGFLYELKHQFDIDSDYTLKRVK